MNNSNDCIAHDISKIQYAPFLFLNWHPNETYYRTAKEIVDTKEHDVGLLQTLFFSKENIEIIQKQLILYVYRKTNKQILIEPQDEKHLIPPMRWLFSIYAKNFNFSIKEQIAELNNKLIESVGPKVITEAQQRVGYIRDSNQMYRLIDRPVSTSTAGNKANPSVTRIYN